MRSDKPSKHPWLRFVATLLKLPFRRKYGLRYVFRRDHVEKFKKNNKPNISPEASSRT